MRIHILGICGTFMGGLALIARQLGCTVTGSDQNVYPPMSENLRTAGVDIQEGYEITHLSPKPDLVIVGNTVKRGNPALEYVMQQGIDYISGPEWLARHVLHKRHVLAVSGTHGKTTTTSLLAWILLNAGYNPGYLIGGVANNFIHTATLGEDPYFVIEADEYDCAFYDKRSKFLHYRPRTLIINNLEYDHADIFPDLQAIKLQFAYLLRTVPADGTVIYPAADANIEDVLTQGCWAKKLTLGTADGWQAQLQCADGSQFELTYGGKTQGTVTWCMSGVHNVQNALAAAAAAHAIHLTSKEIIDGFNSFRGVKRRLEVRGTVAGVVVYDDFAHHPTAIKATLAALRAKVGSQARIIAIVQFASNTMRSGIYSTPVLAEALQDADQIAMLRPELWDINPLLQELGDKAQALVDVNAIIEHLLPSLNAGDHVLIMSNKGFDGIHQALLKRL